MSSDDWRIEFFSQLHEDLTDQPVDLDDVRRSLEERGIDVTATIAEGLKLIADHRRRERLRDARRKLDRLRQVIAKQFARRQESWDSAVESIARALAGEAGGPAYQAYHRKLEKYTDDDLASLREDAELIEFIVELEAESDTEGDI